MSLTIHQVVFSNNITIWVTTYKISANNNAAFFELKKCITSDRVLKNKKSMEPGFRGLLDHKLKIIFISGGQVPSFRYYLLF